ncbi:MAG: hypothetical protein AAF598_18450, partial [Bacteroidota bacterium]
MSKKAIGLITGLMAMALLGIVLMQSYWINYSIRLNEAQFNKNVALALDEVSRKLEREEIQLVSQNFFFPDVPPFRENLAFEEEIFYSIRQNPAIEVEYSFYKNIPEDSFLVIGSDIFYDQQQPDQNCYSQDQMNHLYQVFQQELASHVSRSVPLMERINLNHLDQLLEESLLHKGITIDYDYGLLSNRRQRFVFAKTSEDHLDRKGQVSEAGLHRLLTSMFRVNLFPYDSPGQLMLHFPGKSGFLWQSVWMMLLGSVLFTGIILFCFIYTVQVIFRQKKLGEIKTDFINNMTHEFKTPIATISLAADSINSPIISGNPD